MTDIIRLKDQAARGAHYASLLQSGEVSEALNEIERQFAGEWAGTFDAAERENLWRAVQVTRKIRKLFGEIAGDGKLATHQLSELKRLGK